MIRRNGTYVGIEEERVLSPGEGFGAHVKVLIVRRERNVTIILGPQVFLMLGVLGLDLLHPEVTSPNCFARVNSNFGRDGIRLTCWETTIEADFTPEIGGVWREIE